MTKIGAYLPGFEEKSPLARQTDMANQRDSWLRQMELAQLSEMSQAGAASASGANANKAAPSGSWRAILQPHTAEVRDDHRSAPAPVPHQAAHAIVQTIDQTVTSGDAPAAITPDRALANSAAVQAHAQPPSQSVSNSTNPLQASAVATSVATGEGSLAAADLATSHTVPATTAISASKLTPAAGATPMPQPDATPTGVTSGTDTAPALAAAGGQAVTQVQSQGIHASENLSGKRDATYTASQIGEAAALAGMPTARANLTQAAQAVQSADTTTIRATQSRLSVLTSLSTAPADNTSPEATSTQDEPAPEEAPAADAPLEEKPNWQKRLMHMTGEGEDVRLWIRDKELGPDQTRNLVYRLAGDIAGMGMRLKDATVNGKLAFRSEDDAVSGIGNRSRARRNAAPGGQGTDAQRAIDSNNSTTEEEHGTQ